MKISVVYTDLKLKEIRTNRGLTQKAVADAIHCSTTDYSRYENGKRQPSLDVLDQLASFFDVSVDYLIGRKTVESSALSEYEIAVIELLRKAEPELRSILLDFLDYYILRSKL